MNIICPLLHEWLGAWLSHMNSFIHFWCNSSFYNISIFFTSHGQILIVRRQGDNWKNWCTVLRRMLGVEDCNLYFQEQPLRNVKFKPTIALCNVYSFQFLENTECWMKTGHSDWFLALPVLFTIVLNIFFLVRVVMILRCNFHGSHVESKSCSQKSARPSSSSRPSWSYFGQSFWNHFRSYELAWLGLIRFSRFCLNLENCTQTYERDIPRKIAKSKIGLGGYEKQFFPITSKSRISSISVSKTM